VTGHTCESASVTCGSSVKEDVDVAGGLLVPIGAGWRGTLELLVIQRDTSGRHRWSSLDSVDVWKLPEMEWSPLSVMVPTCLGLDGSARVYAC
jgi:hypothetical protein